MISFNFKRSSPKVISFRDYKNYDINDFRNDVKTTDWKNVYRSNNVNDALQAFNSLLLEKITFMHQC